MLKVLFYLTFMFYIIYDTLPSFATYDSTVNNNHLDTQHEDIFRCKRLKKYGEDSEQRIIY